MIRLSKVSKSFDVAGVQRRVLKDISLNIGAGEIISLVGSNGSGKSTLMRLIAGLLRPDSGSIKIRSDDEKAPLISLAHQSYRESLFPWRTAQDNIRLAFETPFDAVSSKAEIDNFVEEIMERLGISHLANQRPPSMSGGQAQLVAVARALVHPHARILLMDEPFSALDGRNLRKVATELVAISRRNHASILVITHDIDVGILMGDRIVVLTYDSKGVAADIEGPDRSRFDPDFLLDDRFLRCKKDVLATLYPSGELS